MKYLKGLHSILCRSNKFRKGIVVIDEENYSTVTA